MIRIARQAEEKGELQGASFGASRVEIITNGGKAHWWVTTGGGKDRETTNMEFQGDYDSFIAWISRLFPRKKMWKDVEIINVSPPIPVYIPFGEGQHGFLPLHGKVGKLKPVAKAG